jgi:hypothetical protein
MSIKRPSPALIVAIIALVAALTGTAWAALGKNSVGSKQLKKNAVTTAKIKNNAVTTGKIKDNAVIGSKIKDGSITGSKVNLATLGTVPNAASAGTAANLAGQQNFFARLNVGQVQVIATNGAVSLVAACEQGGGNDVIRIYGQTTAPGSILAGDDTLSGPGGSTEFLEPSTEPSKREFISLTDKTGDINVENDIDDGFILGPEGKMISVNSEGVALGLNYGGTTCLAAGVVNLISG